MSSKKVNTDVENTSTQRRCRNADVENDTYSDAVRVIVSRITSDLSRLGGLHSLLRHANAYVFLLITFSITKIFITNPFGHAISLSLLHIILTRLRNEMCNCLDPEDHTERDNKFLQGMTNTDTFFPGFFLMILGLLSIEKTILGSSNGVSVSIFLLWLIWLCFGEIYGEINTERGKIIWNVDMMKLIHNELISQYCSLKKQHLTVKANGCDQRELKLKSASRHQQRLNTWNISDEIGMQSRNNWFSNFGQKTQKVARTTLENEQLTKSSNQPLLNTWNVSDEMGLQLGKTRVSDVEQKHKVVTSMTVENEKLTKSLKSTQIELDKIRCELEKEKVASVSRLEAQSSNLRAKLLHVRKQSKEKIVEQESINQEVRQQLVLASKEQDTQRLIIKSKNSLIAKLQKKCAQSEIDKFREENKALDTMLRHETMKCIHLQTQLDRCQEQGADFSTICRRQTERELAEEKDKQLCVVCQESLRTVVLMPCAHLLMCPTCTGRLKKEKTYSCPVCRTDIQKILNVYW